MKQLGGCHSDVTAKYSGGKRLYRRRHYHHHGLITPCSNLKKPELIFTFSGTQYPAARNRIASYDIYNFASNSRLVCIFGVGLADIAQCQWYVCKHSFNEENLFC